MKRLTLIIILTIAFLAPIKTRATQCCVTTKLTQPFGLDAPIQEVTGCRILAQKSDGSFTQPCTTNEKEVKCEIDGILNQKKFCEQAMIAQGKLTPPTQPPEFKIARPRLQIPLLTLKPFTGTFTTFKDPGTIAEDGKQFLIIDFIANYLGAIYNLFVAIASVIAGVMIVWAGVKWLTSAGSPDRINEARKHITDALVGLILVLGSYIILRTINPQLVVFKPLRVQLVKRIPLEEAEHGGGELKAGASATDPWRLQSCDGFATNGQEFQAYFTHYYKPNPYGNPMGFQPAWTLSNPNNPSSGNVQDTTPNSAFFCAVAMNCSCPSESGSDSTKRCYSSGKWAKDGERHGWPPCAPFPNTVEYCNSPPGLSPGNTVAADRDCFYVRAGCELLVDGQKTVKIMDSGSGIRGRRFDLFTSGPNDEGSVSGGVHTVKIKNPTVCRPCKSGEYKGKCTTGKYRGGIP